VPLGRGGHSDAFVAAAAVGHRLEQCRRHVPAARTSSVGLLTTTAPSATAASGLPAATTPLLPAPLLPALSAAPSVLTPSTRLPHWPLASHLPLSLLRAG